jgi:glutaminyl-tRNA synthetase
LRYAYLITCNEVVKDASGNVTELHCTADMASRGGNSPDGRKVKGTIHWVSARHAVPAEVRLYDRLFTAENPDDAPEGLDFRSNLNPDSLKTITAQVEPCLHNAKAGDKYQFERLGYFCVDPDSAENKLIFNRTVTLKDSWAKQMK